MTESDAVPPEPPANNTDQETEAAIRYRGLRRGQLVSLQWKSGEGAGVF